MFKSLLNSPALQPVIMGQMRHLVTVGGTALATGGYIEGSDISAFAGAVMVLLSLVMSAIAKKAMAAKTAA